LKTLQFIKSNKKLPTTKSELKFITYNMVLRIMAFISNPRIISLFAMRIITGFFSMIR